MERSIAFEVSNLAFSYGEYEVFRNLSFSLPKGKITTFLGSNGCGKSTLFSLLTKNQETEVGALSLYEQEIEDIPLKEFAKQVAIVHQTNIAPDDLTVEGVVQFGRTPHHGKFPTPEQREASQKAVDRALKITQLYSLRDRPIGSLSGGQRQRVFIAMAIAQETKILFLDEPTTYLDVRHQIYILKLVRMLKEVCGMTIVMVLHDINQALAYSDEVLAFSPQGDLLAQGIPAEVVTEELLEDMYEIQLELTEVHGKPFVICV